MTQITKQEFDDLYGDVEDQPVGVEIYRLDVSAGVKVKVREFWASYAGAYFGEDGEDPIHFYSEY